MGALAACQRRQPTLRGAPSKCWRSVQPSCVKGVKASGNWSSRPARAKAIFRPGCAGLTPGRYLAWGSNMTQKSPLQEEGVGV